MVDVHCHILAGLDDGPETEEVSLAMAESAIADGITHVVATPHSSDEYEFDFEKTRTLCDRLQARVNGRLNLATGCDFHLNPENLSALKEEPSRFCIHQRDYLLVEFNEFSIPPSMDNTLHEIQLLGVRPIITHPERNSILREQGERLARWVSLGCRVQVTAGSLLGVFGSRAKKESRRLLAKGLVHIVASDAHGTAKRPLQLKPAFELVRKEHGVEVARALFIENPMAVWEGNELLYVPDLTAGPRRKRFFFF